MQIKAEHLGYWYLRLNGFLTIPNFVVHPDYGPDPETEVDILGVRFPYRAENPVDPMDDEETFTAITDKPFLVIAEVKKEKCRLNGPWKNPARKNMPRVLSALGAFPPTDLEEVGQSLYQFGAYSNVDYHLSLVCLGRERNEELYKRMPLIPQILWDDVLQFVFRRFSKYREPKAYHPQWDGPGKQLWRAFEAVYDKQQSAEDFVQEVQIIK